MNTATALDRHELIETLRTARASLSAGMSGLLDAAIDRLEKYGELGDIIEQYNALPPGSNKAEGILSEAFRFMGENHL